MSSAPHNYQPFPNADASTSSAAHSAASVVHMAATLMR